MLRDLYNAICRCVAHVDWRRDNIQISIKSVAKSSSWISGINDFRSVPVVSSCHATTRPVIPESWRARLRQLDSTAGIGTTAWPGGAPLCPAPPLFCHSQSMLSDLLIVIAHIYNRLISALTTASTELTPDHCVRSPLPAPSLYQCTVCKCATINIVSQPARICCVTDLL